MFRSTLADTFEYKIPSRVRVEMIHYLAEFIVLLRKDLLPLSANTNKHSAVAWAFRLRHVALQGSGAVI